MIRATRFASAYGAVAAAVIRGLVGDRPAVEDNRWGAGPVIAASAAACHAAGKAPGHPVVLVAAAVRTYVAMFLPWGFQLTDLVVGDDSVLVWDVDGQDVHDVLWVETWDTPLPLSPDLASLGDCVRLLDLGRPFASRLYGQDLTRTTLAALPWFAPGTGAADSRVRQAGSGARAAETLVTAAARSGHRLVQDTDAQPELDTDATTASETAATGTTNSSTDATGTSRRRKTNSADGGPRGDAQTAKPTRQQGTRRRTEDRGVA